MDIWSIERDEKFFQNLEEELLRSYMDLKWYMSKYYVDDIPMQPNTITQGQTKFSSMMACELYQVYQFVRGNTSQDKRNIMEIRDTIQGITEFVWSNPFLPANTYRINWEVWRENTYHGFLIYIAFKRIELIGTKSFSAKDLSIMAGVVPQTISNNINNNNIEAKKDGNNWIVPNSEAVRYLQEDTDLTIYDNI